ncbi:hypothetical protein [Billgrantia aerodenitrificans]|uniref:Uncharacterized protein n=1 Tax=Billgrantia aerodenitrificans TaxID=2733483 RepID=A0ABS9AN23_9GAMM|nr:hypothetical protein [Halomonas aerodenitrificans]MCE8023164.1 hypothetical protein [Halomonas aerodenitrificans]
MAKQDEQDVSIDGKDVSGDPLVSHDQPLEKLRGSVYEYDQPYDPVGTEDWAVLEVSHEPWTLAVWRAAGELFQGIEQQQIAGCTRK